MSVLLWRACEISAPVRNLKVQMIKAGMSAWTEADYTRRPVLITAKNINALICLACLCLLISACGGAASRDLMTARLSEDEKHRLYAAALAASESPVDSEIFKRVCRQIEIFDAAGKPNEGYMQFVSAHVEWATKAQTEEFRSQIKTPEKARQYINQNLSG